MISKIIGFFDQKPVMQEFEPIRARRGNTDGVRHRRVGRSGNGGSDESPQSFLTQSLEDIPLFRARYSSIITDEQRIELILNELNLVRKEVETKSIETQCKANWFRIVNTLISLVILLSSAVIIGLQAASDCINYPVIVLSSIIFTMEGTHKLFRWGPQGVLYKSGSMRLRGILRQVREYMYMFHRYSAEQLLALISQLRAQYDDIDMGLYKTSMTGAAKFNTGFDIEEGGGGNFAVPAALNLNNHPTPVLHPTPTNASTPVLVPRDQSSPHVHIHIDNPQTPLPSVSPNPSVSVMPSPYMPEKNDTPILIVPSIPIRLDRIGTPGTPRRMPASRLREPPENMPTIKIETDDGTPPISIHPSDL